MRRAPTSYRSYQGKDLEKTSCSTNLLRQVRYQLSPSSISTTYLTSSRSYSNGSGPYFYLVPGADNSVNSLSPTRTDQLAENNSHTIYEAQQLFNSTATLQSATGATV